ncbi:Leucine Rich Repeat [Seminavis robusta]|uniref:Leucine Rich Repeat n=1 Tax=Seminavis robusta TaxID=568900 RepID=A0A9N8DHN7_9STRA|nr:Leucine Rich Repeat [Seminavis robusta]|eukprot:Sro148_g068230.1 Leucine Rich Repeat (791) ;mRNA; r:83116-85660
MDIVTETMLPTTNVGKDLEQAMELAKEQARAMEIAQPKDRASFPQENSAFPKSPTSEGNALSKEIQIQQGATLPSGKDASVMTNETTAGDEGHPSSPFAFITPNRPDQSESSKTKGVSNPAIDEFLASALIDMEEMPTQPGSTATSNQRNPSKPGAYAIAPTGGSSSHETQEAVNPSPDTVVSLNDAESGLAVANPVSFHEMSQDFLPPAKELKERETNLPTTEHGTNLPVLLGCVLMLFATIVVGVVMGIATQENSGVPYPQAGSEPKELFPLSEYPSGAPTTLADAWAGLPESTILALEDPMTPQSRAYEWIMNDPNRTSYPDWKVLQRFALAVFYYSTGGEEWNLQKDWLSYTVDECSWYCRGLAGGVEHFFLHEGIAELASEQELVDSACNDDEKYSNLVFTENNMYGTLPPELSLLSDSLLYLEVGANENIYGLIPSEIGLMTSLKRFYTDRNQHTGQIPTEIGQLCQLEELDLGSNLFTGFIPSEIGNMEALSFLSLRYNSDMTGTLPTELYGLTNMVTFQVQKLEKLIGGNILPEIGRMTKLDYFNVHHITFNSSLPTEIGLLSNSLRRLNVWNCSITGTLPSELFQLTNMWRIDIDDNEITGTIPTEFGRFTNLTMAWMNGNSFSGTLPASIFDSWGQLSYLKIHNNNLEGPLPSELGQLTNLRLLWLSHNQFFGTIPSQLGLLNNVTELFLHDTNLVGTIPESLTDMAELEMLTVSNTSLTGSIPNPLCDQIWDMTHTCNVYFGGMWTLCYDVERVNFTCSSSNLCGCDVCGACNSSTIGS